MKQLETLFRAILDEPWDDTHRLVYADCLDEAGQPQRAQFIRLQVEAARLPADDPSRGKLERKAEGLARGHKSLWKAELPKLRGVTWGDFERGFVGQVSFRSAYVFRAHVRKVADAVPLEVAQLRNASSLKTLAGSDCLARVRELRLGRLRMSKEMLGELVASPHLGRLQTLSLEFNGLQEDSGLLLAQAKTLGGLQRLVLSGNPLSAAARQALQGRFGPRVIF